jgi:hypothetical protein
MGEPGAIGNLNITSRGVIEMTDLATGLDAQQRDDAGVVTTEAVQTSALITEHEVLIGSTSALAGPEVRRRGFRAAVRALFASTDKAHKPEKGPKPRHYPKQYSFIEYAAMSRMMDRL